jgi:putative ABC transport system permease protein
VFRSYLMAALRNLARNRLYAGINIVGLSVGFTAAILMALFVHSEFNYDTFFPEFDRVFSVAESTTDPDEPTLGAPRRDVRLAPGFRVTLL